MKMLGFKLLAFFVVVFGAPMIILGPSGKPIMSIDDWIPRDFIGSVKSMFNSLGNAVESGADALDDQVLGGKILGAGAEIYTWRDEQGVTHYSDTPVAGAHTTAIPENNTAIPAQPVRSRNSALSKNNALLLEDRSLKTTKKSSAGQSAASLEDLNTMIGGDYSKAPVLLKNLPQLLEQAKQARQIEHK